MIINGIFFAGKINQEGVLTLPDVYAKKYGKTVEVLVSLTTITSFIMLLAGNLVGMGFICAYVWGISQTAGIWIAAAIIWGYTVSGGLLAVAYTDCVQGVLGWSGCIVAVYWFIVNADENAATPSVGFPGYIYPNDELCLKYSGVPCTNNAALCCYNETRWCETNGTNCFADVSGNQLAPRCLWNRFVLPLLTRILSYILERRVAFGRQTCFQQRAVRRASAHPFSKFYLLELGDHFYPRLR